MNKPSFSKGGHIKRLSEGGDAIDYTPLTRDEDGNLIDENGGRWTSAEEWLRQDAQKNPEKYSPIYPRLGEPLKKEHSYIDRTAAVDGEGAYRTQHPDGTITGIGGKKLGEVVPGKPEFRFSGNDIITRHIIDEDTVYMMARPTPYGYEDRRGRAKDKDVNKYRQRTNTGWQWKRNVWNKLYNSGIFTKPEYIQLEQVFKKAKK